MRGAPMLHIQGYQSYHNPLEPYIKNWNNFVGNPKKNNNKKRILYSRKDSTITQDNILTEGE